MMSSANPKHLRMAETFALLETEREGFEPSNTLLRYSISSAAP
jgi:hypothetical protein